MTDHSYQQAGGVIEVQRGQRPVQPVSLHHRHVLVVDGRRWTNAQLRERLSDLRGKRKLRVQSRAVPLASAQLVFPDDRERRRNPAGSAVVRPDAVATVWIFRKTDVCGAFVWSSSRHFHDAAATEPAIADTFPCRDKAGDAGDSLGSADRLQILV